MTKLEKMVIEEILDLAESASRKLNNLAADETNSKKPELGEFARTDSRYYVEVHEPLQKIERWTEALLNK